MKQHWHPEHTQTNRQLQLLCTYQSTVKSYIDKLMTVLRTRNYKILNDCFMQLCTP